MSTKTSTVTTPKQRLPQTVSVPLMAYSIEATSSFLPSATANVAAAAAGSSSASVISTLRSLYPRAANALLQRDFALAATLVDSAFELLPSPSGAFSIPDVLDTHRRKWDILRITLETSAFASPPAKKHGSADDVLPSCLRANLMLSGPGLITELHARSLRLFTPRQQSPKAAFLPAQILVPLVLSSLKLHCPDVARSMIEDWLALRESVESTRLDAEGYERVVELFCLHVLPRLHEWEYAQEFLKYESELPEDVRQHLKSSLHTLQTQEIEAARSIPSPPPDLPSSSSANVRTPSPSPSVESSSSSDTDDTHSTRTIVPHTPRPKQGINGFAKMTPTPSASCSSLVDAKRMNGHAMNGLRPASPASILRVSPSPSVPSTAARADLQNRALGARNHVSTTALVMFTFRAYLSQLSSSRLLYVLLCVLIPLCSLFRIRWRQHRQSGGRPGMNVDTVRRRLAGQPSSGVVSAMWGEVIRAVSDAVRMAGGGLV